MNGRILQDIGLEDNLEPIQKLFGAPVMLVLANARGSVLDSTNSLNAAIEETITGIILRTLSTPDSLAIKTCRRGSGSITLLSEIDIRGEALCLVLFGENTRGTSYFDSDIGLDVVTRMFQSVIEVVQLNIELDDMADDLTARYEELNLFYGLDDIVEIKDARKGHIALKKLADSCCRYLDVDVVSIAIESTRLEVESHSNRDDGFRQGWDESSKGLRLALSEFLHAHDDVHIYNDATAIDAITSGNFSAKIAATPVHSVNGEILGQVIMCRRASEKDFSNSDRRLIRVVAEQASTVVGASFDIMTGLLNRDGFMMLVELAIRANAQRLKKSCVVLFDVDQFRIINDGCGRSAGNELLKRVAGQLKQIVPTGSAIARLESDKFALIIEGEADSGVEQLVSEIQKGFSTAGFRWRNKGFDITAGVGIVEIQNDFTDADSILALASVSIEVAKKRGAGGVFIYDPDSDQIEATSSAIDWVPRIRQALDENLFELFGQKIVPLNKVIKNKVHFEILLRLQSEEGQYQSPFQMIKAAEKYNIVSRIDEWVITNAIRTLQSAKDLYPDIEVSFSVNVSGQSVNDEFFAKVASLLRSCPECIPLITLEITETAVVSNLNSATRLMESLRQLGVKFSLDDFGTGMSSFGYLRDLPIDHLKIDGSFVRHIVDDPVSCAMVESIHNVGHIMGLSTVAEFVENDSIIDKLKKIGVDFGQGYALNKPAPILQQIADFSKSIASIDKDKAAGELTQLSRSRSH